MAKRLVGVTVAYDATNDIYRKTEIYESENPADTVELRIIDDVELPFDRYDVDEGSGPWRRIIRPKEDQAAMRTGPFVLEKHHIKRGPGPDDTVEGIPFVRDP